MSKFVAFFVSLSLFSAPLAMAQDLSTEQEEALKKILIEKSISNFGGLQKAQTKCLVRDESRTNIYVLLAGLVTAQIGKNVGYLSVSKQILAETAMDQAAKLDRLETLARTGRVAGYNGRGAIRRGGFKVAVGVAVFNYAYGFITGRDFFTEANFKYLWKRFVTDDTSTEAERAEYYLTEKGFAEFLQLTSVDEIKRMFEINPRLMLAVSLAVQMVINGDCNALEKLDPTYTLGSLPAASPTSSQKTKGEEL